MYKIIGGAALLFAVVGCSADWPEEPIDECGRFTYCEDNTTTTTRYRPTITQQPEICLKAYKPKPKPPKPKVDFPEVVQTTTTTSLPTTTTTVPTTTTTTYSPPTTTTNKC